MENAPEEINEINDDTLLESEKALTTHFRLTLKDKAEADALIPKLLEKFRTRIVSYCFGYEELPDNNHVHGNILWTKLVPKSTMGDFMLSIDKKAKWYNKPVETTVLQNQLYVLKELELVCTNYDTAKLKALMDKNIAIKIDKAMDMRHKLLNLVKDNKNIKTLYDLKKFIYLHYVNVLDKEPPFAHLRGYIAYIAIKDDRLVNEYFRMEFGDRIVNIEQANI